MAHNTVQAYTGDVGRFLDWLAGQGVAIDDTHALELGDYVFQLTRAGKRRSSIKRNVSAIRSFYRFLTVTRRIDRSPIPSARM